MRDKIKNLLTQADRDAIDDHIAQIEAILSSKLTALNAEERARFGRINEKNKLLVNKVFQFRESQPQLSSPDVDWDEFETDYHARGFLETRSGRLNSLVYRMESAKILHDNDNYDDSRRDYKFSKYKNDSGIDGFSVKVDELKQFFNRTGIPKGSGKKHKG